MELFTRIRDRYDRQTTAYYAASHLWIDAIIDPADTRKVISMGIEMADHQPVIPKYNVGLIQT
jgi:acetyl-CoA carboxylase carboxyltransferase component